MWLIGHDVQGSESRSFFCELMVWKEKCPNGICTSVTWRFRHFDCYFACHYLVITCKIYVNSPESGSSPCSHALLLPCAKLERCGRQLWRIWFCQPWWAAWTSSGLLGQVRVPMTSNGCVRWIRWGGKELSPRMACMQHTKTHSFLSVSLQWASLLIGCPEGGVREYALFEVLLSKI